MSNHFPAVSGDLLLAQLSYAALLPGPSLQPSSPVNYAGVSGQLSYVAPQMGAVFDFTPGQSGSFDQDAFEAHLTGAVTAVLQVLAGMSGSSLAALQAQTDIRRNWKWADSAGYQLIWQDSVAYPA